MAFDLNSYSAFSLVWKFSLVAWLIVVGITLSVVPGWRFTSAARLNPLARLAASCVVSFVLLFVLQAAAHAMRLPQLMAIIVLLALLGISLPALVRDIRRHEFPWHGVCAWTALILIYVATQTRIVVHGLPYTYFDWWEHWQRSLWFAEQSSMTASFGHYSIAARGPLCNAAAAMMMVTGCRDDYWAFQIVSIVLNSFPLLPFALIMADLTGMRQKNALLCAVLISAAVPFFYWNSTCTVTKSFTAGFILVAFYLYRKGITHDRADLACASVFCLAAGLLAHYLTLIYAIFLGVHFAYMYTRMRWSYAPLIYSILASSIFVGGWFGYLFTEIGFVQTLRANTTLGNYYVARNDDGQPESYLKIVYSNLVVDFIPRVFHQKFMVPDEFANPHTNVVALGERIHTESLPAPWKHRNGIYGVVGASGSAIVLLCLGLITVRRCRIPSRRLESPGWKFWLAFFTLGTLMNVLPIRWYNYDSTLSLNMHATCYLGFAFVAGVLVRWPKPAALLAFGVFMLESAAITWGFVQMQRVTADVHVTRHHETITMRIEKPFGVFSDYLSNLQLKEERRAEYLFDFLGAYRETVFAVLLIIGFGVLWLACHVQGDTGESPESNDGGPGCRAVG